ncbi:hypothetical protein LLG95_10825 [bacterium]|nr:hypothetical protein [bacterium]
MQIGNSRLYVTGLIGLLALSIATGCTTSKITGNIGPDGEQIAFKRYERHADIDFLHHFTRTVYHEPGVYFGPSGDDQIQVVSEWGRPNFIRKFKSMTGEHVVEWLYRDNCLLFQFIRDELVFTGPITGVEEVLLSHGRPDSYDIYSTDAGVQSMNFVYSGLIFSKLENFKFNNDKLILKSTGN